MSVIATQGDQWLQADVQSGDDIELRTLRVGLLGLGVVGQGVARLIRAQAPVFAQRGVRFEVCGALVRDTHRRRNAPVPHERITSDPEQFFAQDYDVVIEAIGGVPDAGRYVERALRSGLPVVTANKSLVAARGPALRRLARDAGVALCHEAAVIAGVPFLGNYIRRPLTADVQHFAGIINGTSNFIISMMERENVSLSVALHEAQQRGFAEPNPANDLNGTDAAEKLLILLQAFGCGAPTRETLEVTGIEDLSIQDITQAAALGGTIRPLALATRRGSRTEAFVGPAFVPAAHPLAQVRDQVNALNVRTGTGLDLFLSGPGAGPEATAATILDDALEATQGAVHPTAWPVDTAGPAELSTPETGWLLRLALKGEVPAAEEVAAFLGAHGIWLRALRPAVQGEDGALQYALTCPAPRLRIDLALSALRHATGGSTFAIRALECK